MLVYAGSLAGNVASLGYARAACSPLQRAMYGVGFLATVAVTVYVTRTAKRALENL